jgi:N-acetylmuramoyl-L-alanine amidase
VLHRGFTISTAHFFPTKSFLLIICALAALPPEPSSRADEFLIFQKQGRRSLPKVIVDQTSYLPIIDFLNIVDLPYSESVSAGYVQISVGRDQVRLDKDKSQAFLNGTPITMSAPVVVAGKQWLVPPEFVERVLNRVLPEKIGVAASGDRFFLGGVAAHRITVKPIASEQGTRIALQLSSPIQAEIRQQGSKISFSFGGVAIDPGKEGYAYKDERVRSIRFETTEASDQLVIELADGTLRPRVSHLASQNVYLVEVNRPESLPADAAMLDGIAVPRIAADPRRWRHITIDAGHGGEDRGIALKENVFEKNVALDIARRVRWALQTRLGVEVVLSRSQDESVSLENRVLAANKAQSNLFISIHIGNASQAQESRSYAYVAKPAGDVAPPDVGVTHPHSLFVPWEEVQLASLTWSQRLAESLQAEMNRTLNGGNSRLAYRTAPLRLLSSLAMPAVLLEIGNARQREFREKVNDAQFQNLVTATVVTSVEKFRSIHERTDNAAAH